MNIRSINILMVYFLILSESGFTGLKEKEDFVLNCDLFV